MLALQLDLSVSLTLYSKSFRFCHGKKSFQRRSQTLDTCKGKLQIRSCVEFEHEACKQLLRKSEIVVVIIVFDR